MTVAVKQFLGRINRRFVGRRKLTCVFKAFRQLDVNTLKAAAQPQVCMGPDGPESMTSQQVWGRDLALKS